MWPGVGASVSDNDDSGIFEPGRQHRSLEGRAYLYARAQAAMVVRIYHPIPASEQADIVQTVLAHACQAMAKPDFVLQKDLGAFIRTLAHRSCINWLRKPPPHVTVPIDRPSLSPLPDERMIANERQDLATQILERLAPTCRELIQKHVYEGLSYAEIAATTGRTEGALRVEMCKCLKKAKELAQELSRPPDGGGRNGGQ